MVAGPSRRGHVLHAAADGPGVDEVPELVPHPGDGVPVLLGRLHLHPALGPAPLRGGDEALTGGWVGLRDDPAPLDAPRLCALADAWWPAIFARRTALAAVPTLDLTVHLRHTAPVTGPVLARFATGVLQEGHLEEVGSLWAADGTLLAESRQLALLLDR